MKDKKIIANSGNNDSVSYEKEEKYFLNEMKRSLEKEKRREIVMLEEINIFTGGKQVVLRNYK